MKVIDSHIHLSSLANQRLLKWQGDHVLNKNCRLEDYVEENSLEVDGIIIIEFSALNTENHQGTIDEYKYYSRVIQGTLDGEEGSNDLKHLVKAVIPWVPMNEGADKVESYIENYKDDSFPYVKGFRYLLQDKPPQVMTTPQFISSLKYLDDNNFTFDWGIDLRCGGWWQFEETLEVFQKVPNVKYIINHLCKPTYKAEDVERWGKFMKSMYELTPNSYMKLSGGFSELEKNDDLDECVELIYPWFKIVMDLWGVERTIWASNWPVCAMFTDDLNKRWFTVTEKLFDRINLPVKDRQRIYNENYLSAYNL
ncbi:L-rhamnono-gamma-lactonase [[Candida] jaroonii]|uniref:L-rhamnono-gamma-lactonase n=1 Tax=[Candida] jaroonii TaxID=467808 RepID=A0ACA9YF25_9ASCO|nr:L-rhamnono-gamma-lactonase [[Candida] jaroonii]